MGLNLSVAMKILIISWRDITHPEAGGAEVHLHEITKRLANFGHEITILCSRYNGCSDEETIDTLVKILLYGLKQEAR